MEKQESLVRQGGGEGGRAQPRWVGGMGPPRCCQLVFSDPGGWYMGANLYSVSLLRVILPPGNTGQCLGRFVVVTPEVALACSGWGQGCCLTLHSAQDGPTENGPAPVSVVQGRGEDPNL